MLFFEDEIEKVRNIVGKTGRNTMNLQDPRINGELQRELNARKMEAKNLRDRRNRLLKGYDW
ncbi:hypothetical protein [Sporosarcina ureilytica]|uniref:Uncharacterized protein n=1 Tax=Sporosarcina ureilytica TaxID=298596 RepID=A0A1D8JDE5_9BACL|nr:hypothetical protein [Sporosarcina ureilytica]AOV06726.1 hypothetical protein BI350_03375 [Sporosarcina ureilytica]